MSTSPYTCFNGDSKIKNIHYENSDIRFVYHGSNLIWTKRYYTPGQIIFDEEESGSYSFKIKNDGIYQIYAVGAGGGTVLANAADEYWNGGWFGSSAAAAGGSGAFVYGKFFLPLDSILSITVGAKGEDKYDQLTKQTITHNVICDGGGSSSIVFNETTLIYAAGGGGGQTENSGNNNYYSKSYGGAGGSGSVNLSALEQSIINGNQGTASHAGWDIGISVTGGASVSNGAFPNKDYGKSSSGYASPPFSYSFTDTGKNGYVRIVYFGENY